jgi:hypothetical protein
MIFGIPIELVSIQKKVKIFLIVVSKEKNELFWFDALSYEWCVILKVFWMNCYVILLGFKF